jgi:hypothetical protein
VPAAARTSWKRGCLPVGATCSPNSASSSWTPPACPSRDRAARSLVVAAIRKDYRPDLHQMIIGLVMDQDGRPLCCELWPGNIATHRRANSRLRLRACEDRCPGPRVKFRLLNQVVTGDSLALLGKPAAWRSPLAMERARCRGGRRPQADHDPDRPPAAEIDQRAGRPSRTIWPSASSFIR